jgi:hypothetical protein
VETNSNSENARSRMLASVRGIMCTRTKEEASSTWCTWAAGFHRVKARSSLGRVLELMYRLFLEFSKFFLVAVKRDYLGSDCICFGLIDN